MSIASDLVGQTFKTTIYETVVGKIEVETEILIDGSISSTMWVIFPDGLGNEVFSVQEACDMLEI